MACGVKPLMMICVSLALLIGSNCSLIISVTDMRVRLTGFELSIVRSGYLLLYNSKCVPVEVKYPDEYGLDSNCVSACQAPVNIMLNSKAAIIT